MLYFSHKKFVTATNDYTITKCKEQDSDFQRPTGIWRHRLRAPFGLGNLDVTFHIHYPARCFGMYMPKSRVSQARNYADSVISVHREAWYCERSEQYHFGTTWEQIGRTSNLDLMTGFGRRPVRSCPRYGHKRGNVSLTKERTHFNAGGTAGF